jgi:hypothetical protein
MELYRTSFDENTEIILQTDGEFLRYIDDPR